MHRFLPPDVFPDQCDIADRGATQQLGKVLTAWSSSLPSIFWTLPLVWSSVCVASFSLVLHALIYSCSHASSSFANVYWFQACIATCCECRSNASSTSTVVRQCWNLVVYIASTRLVTVGNRALDVAIAVSLLKLLPLPDFLFFRCRKGKLL